MRAYFIRRLLLIPPTLIGVTFIVFMITRFVPGGPVERMMASMRQASADGGASAGIGEGMALSDEQLLSLKRQYLLDQPAIPAYGMWLGAWPREYYQKDIKFLADETEKNIRSKGPRDKLTVVRGSDGDFSVRNQDGTPADGWKVRAAIETEIAADKIPEGEARAVVYRNKFSGLITGYLGESTRYQDPVWSLIRERLPISIYYGLMTMLIVYVISIPLGVIKAIKHRTHLDNWSSILIFFGFAIPGYALGSLLVLYLGTKAGWFPVSGFTSHNFVDMGFWEKIWDVLHHSALPLLCYVISGFAFVTLMMKNHLMDNLAADYIRTAIAKGVEFKKAVRQHAFRNSLIPIATNLGHQITLFVTGSFLIERVFDINGFGLLGFESLIDRDYPVVLGILVLSSTLMLLGNILSDILVALVDPRVRFK